MAQLGRPKGKTEETKTVSIRMPGYLVGAIQEYQKQHDLNQSEAIKELIAGGINFYMVMDDE